MITFEIPLRLINTSNTREHWRAVAKRKKEQRGLGEFYTLAAGPSLLRTLRGSIHNGVWMSPPLNITITRIGKRQMDDDGLACSAKFVRDGIADALGIDDGDVEKIIFAYRQECGKVYGVRVTIERRGEKVYEAS